MINLKLDQTVIPQAVADVMLTSAYPSAIGVSTGPYGTIFHLPDGINTANAQSIFDGYGQLTVNADKTTMTEGDADPVITVSSNDATLGWVVLDDDGQIYASGEDAPVSGTLTLNLVGPVEGVYRVFVYRNTGDYASGSVQITVNGA